MSKKKELPSLGLKQFTNGPRPVEGESSGTRRSVFTGSLSRCAVNDPVHRLNCREVPLDVLLGRYKADCRCPGVNGETELFVGRVWSIDPTRVTPYIEKEKRKSNKPTGSRSQNLSCL